VVVVDAVAVKDVIPGGGFHVFDGDRINDHHLSLDEKRKAREKIK